MSDVCVPPRHSAAGQAQLRPYGCPRARLLPRVRCQEALWHSGQLEALCGSHQIDDELLADRIRVDPGQRVEDALELDPGDDRDQNRLL
eukprot:7006403-Prymnesium_polylepis.1